MAHSLSSTLEASDDINYSTGWIYGYRPFGYYQGEGMYMREALKTIKNLGAVENKDFDFNVEMQEAKVKVDENFTLLEALADNCKISSYCRLNSNEEIKAWICKKLMPVPICIKVGDLKLDRDNIIQIPTKTNGGHAILVIGWDETGFIIQNSWGKNWGDNGTAILPYEYTIQEAWGVEMLNIVTPNNNTNIKKPALYILRKVIQLLLNVLSKTLKGGNR